MKFELNSLFHHGKKFFFILFGFASKKFVPDKAKKEKVAISLAQNLAAK